MLNKLESLEVKLNQFKIPQIDGLGHNHPPEPKEDDFLEIKEAKISILNLKKELSSKKPSKKKIEKNKNVILQLGLKLAIWAGSGINTFYQAAAVAAGTGFGAWASGLGPQILNTVKSLSHFIQTLP